MHDASASTEGPTLKQLPPFIHPTGPTPRTRREKTPLHVFQLFITVVLLQSVVTQTKVFAAKKGVDFEFVVEELQAFIGLNIAMGLLRLPQVRDYWSTSEILSTPWFATIMSRDRFFSIMRHLHLVDPGKQKRKGEEGYDALFKVRPLVDHLSAVFARYYNPERHLSIDEMMIGTRCRIAFLQYLPNKPTKFGIKVWVIAEAKTGYVLGFQIYTGASQDDQSKGLAYRIVMDLIEPFVGKDHSLYTDNFYTSPCLYLDLLQKKVYGTGTVRVNRKGFPDALKVDKKSSKNILQIGEYRFAQHGELTAVLWHDRRDVYVLSTAHNHSVTQVLKRPKGSREKTRMPCPTCIDDYNNFMGGVDLVDQNVSYYSLTQRKTIKWWKKIFWRLIDLSILNAWVIFRHNFPDSPIKTQRGFRHELIRELVQPLLFLKASPLCPLALQSSRSKQPKSIKRLVGKHFPYRAGCRRKCVVCGSKPMFWCPKCDMHLCIGKCFEVFHTRSKY